LHIYLEVVVEEGYTCVGFVHFSRTINCRNFKYRTNGRNRVLPGTVGFSDVELDFREEGNYVFYNKDMPYTECYGYTVTGMCNFFPVTASSFLYLTFNLTTIWYLLL